MTSKTFSLVLSANAHRILMRKSDQTKNHPSLIIEELIMEHLLTTKEKVDDVMKNRWISDT